MRAAPVNNRLNKRGNGRHGTTRPRDRAFPASAINDAWEFVETRIAAPHHERKTGWLVGHAHLFPKAGDFTWSTFQLKKSKLPDHVWILPPQTSQLKLPECLCGCCSLVAVYGSPQLGQRKCSVVQRSLAMPRLCDAPSTCSSAMVCHNQRPATRMLEPGEYLISTSLTS
jgi:hypothetical protein